ncbi:MAG: hypothetical protein ACXWKC_08810 [Xanthobacteraceae bacterium]
MRKLSIFFLISIVTMAAFSTGAEARYRRHYARAVSVDFWGHCWIHQSRVWWLTTCPLQRVAYR